jgi:hypothetical protein
MLDVIVHFKDKISKTLYPWRYAFWIYMGTRFEKWQGVPAKRQAYEKLLGPTLAEELQNPVFLASLDPLVRSAWLAAEPQMRLDFNSPPEPAGVEKSWLGANTR